MSVFSSLSARLTLLVLAAFVPAFGLVAYGYLEAQHRLSTQVKENALDITREVSADQEQLIAGTRQLLVTLTRVPEVRQSDSGACPAFLADLMAQQPFYSNFLVARPDGEVTCSAVPLPAPVNIADREHFQRALKTSNFAIGQYLVGRIQRAPTFPIAYPIVAADGHVESIVIATVSLDWLNHLAASARVPDGARLTVFDRDGTVLASYPDSEAWVGQSMPPALLQYIVRTEQGQGTTEASDLDGQSRLIAFAPLDHTLGKPDVYVSVGFPAEEAFADVDRTFTRNLEGLALLALLVLGLTHLAAHLFILKPVRQLLSAARQLASADLSVRIGSPRGPRELRQLAETFDRMAEVLQARDGQLQEQSERLGALVEASRAFTGARLDLNSVLKSITRHVAENIGDACVLRILTPDRRALIPTVVHHPDAAHLKLLGALLNGPPQPVDEGYSGRVLTTGQAITIPELDAQSLPGLRPELRPYVQRFGIHSLLVVPLRVRDEVIGTVSVWRDTPGCPYSTDDQEFLQALADHAAQAIENAQLYTRAEQAVAELQETQRQVVQQERLRALGTMASGIAHDFNNALAPVLGYSELLLVRPTLLQNTNRARELLELIHTAAEDATSVVRRLREFYRFRERDDTIEPVDLNGIVQESIALTQPKWKDQAQRQGATIQLATDLHELPLVPCNPTEIREALANLIFNAVDALPTGGTITLATNQMHDLAVLKVIDTGLGMTEDIRERCLEPFFTTKAERGTGLGLAMVFGIVQRHGGSIDVQSTIGVGTTVTLSLPLVSAVAEPVIGTADPPLAAEGLRVLLVDDERRARDVVAELLAVDGHQLETAASGQEGLRLFRDGRFDVVITDQAMPQVSGDRLAALIKQRSPDMPIILLTGFGDMMLAQGEKPEGIDVVLTKPVTLAMLRLALARVTHTPIRSEPVMNGIAKRA
ncbi:MAG TPA: ATP-binding protein [Chloroflexota bacterium]|nr:ATP-binding protein [Chloroflexota bacterium]